MHCTIWKCICAKWWFWHMPCFVKIHHPFLHQHIVPPSCATSGDVRWVDGWERLCQMCLFDQDQTKKPCEAIKDHNLPQNPPRSPSWMLERLLVASQPHWPQPKVVVIMMNLTWMASQIHYVIHQTCGWLRNELMCSLDHLLWH